MLYNLLYNYQYKLLYNFIYKYKYNILYYMLYNIKYNYKYKHLYKLTKPQKSPSTRNITAKLTTNTQHQIPPKPLYRLCFDDIIALSR